MPPFDWTGKWKPLKQSRAVFLRALFLGFGVQVEFFRLVFRDVEANGSHGAKFFALPLYWLLWNALPVILFAISSLLKKQGR
jgi:hypothetical protein